jgi:2-polyprenyl-6-methoxyphenol hydroxylase-like FAD-dependent oxidoreductase
VLNVFGHTADVFIVGGGPAGLAAAILAARSGMSVAVADHNRLPMDKACGEGLMPDTVAALQNLGIDLRSLDAATFQGIRFHDIGGYTSVAASFTKGFGLGMRRTVLHEKLVRRAADLGATLLWGARIAFDRQGAISCDGRPVRCRYLIGADGEGSTVRKWAGLNRTRFEQTRFGARQHFDLVPWSESVEVYWARDCQVVAAPVAPGTICVAVTSRNPFLKFHDALQQVPKLARRIAGVPALSTVRGARTSLRWLRRVHCGRIALIGDASGSVDPLTGEGLGLAFKQAAALVNAIQCNDLNRYQIQHDRFGRAPRLMSRFMLLMDAHPVFRRRTLRALAAEPFLFSRLLDLNVGACLPSKYPMELAIRLGWRLIHPVAQNPC